MNKMLRHQLQYSRAVVAAGRPNLDAIASRIEARFGSGEGLEPDAMKGHLSGLLELLERATEAYESANTDVATDVAEDVVARNERVAAGVKLSKILTTARSRIRENLGEDMLRVYQLDGTVPRDKDGLEHYAARGLELLAKEPRTAADALGGEFDTAAVVTAVEPVYDAYADTLGAEEREKQETQAARATRDEVESRFSDALYNTAAILTAHLRMAGLVALADRVRPTLARTSGEAEVEVPGEGVEQDEGTSKNADEPDATTST